MNRACEPDEKAINVTWLQKLRLRVFAIIGAVSIVADVGFSLPLWAVLGAVVGTVLLTVNTMAARLDSATCLGCGQDLSKEPSGEHGVVCPACGSVSLPLTYATPDVSTGSASPQDEQDN